MGNGTMRRAIQVLAAALIAAMPATATAHVLMKSPPPRSDADGLKPPEFPGPCGNVPRTSSFTQYEPGATIDVTFMETIAHTGCFQIAFSEAGDEDFKVLAQMIDPPGGKGMSYTLPVKLPEGVTCKACTIQLRQQMSGTASCPEDPDAEDPIPGTYYSCADIRVGDFPDADADGGPPDAGVDSGVSTTPTDGGGKTTDEGRKFTSSGDEGDGGCSVALAGAGGTSALAAAVAGALAVLGLRRRRRR